MTDDFGTGGPHEQPFEREPFAYPTDRAFVKLLDALGDVAVLSTELGYPKSADRNDEITEKADQLIHDIKELEEMMADERGLTERERRCLRSDPTEVFLDDEQ